MPKKWIHILLSLLLVTGFGAQAFGAEVTEDPCRMYSTLITKNMPSEVGSSKLAQLLSVEPYQWIYKMELEQFFSLLNDDKTFSGPSGVAPDTLVGKFESENSFCKFNLAKGELRYANRNRLAFNEKMTTAYDPEKSAKLVNQLLASIGLQSSDYSVEDVESRVLKGGIAKRGSAKPETVVDIERTSFAPRKTNGIPVLDSLVIVGINNSGQISRLRIAWPALLLDPALSKQSVVAFEDMVQRVSARLYEEQGCQELDVLKMYLAYEPVKVADGDANDGVAEVNQQVTYAPRLMVAYRPNDRKQEEAGSVLGFDLFEENKKSEVIIEK